LFHTTHVPHELRFKIQECYFTIKPGCLPNCDVLFRCQVSWGYVCPALCVLLVVVSIAPPFAKMDVMNARKSKPFPEGGDDVAGDVKRNSVSSKRS